MAIQTAKFTNNVAGLDSDWGLKVAIEKFGPALVESFPLFTRGPRKGKRKGFLCWTKCTEGGWTRYHPLLTGLRDRGGVMRPGTYGWRLTMERPESDPRGHTLVATWDWNHGTPEVRSLQTPSEAAARFKEYRSNARFG